MKRLIIITVIAFFMVATCGAIGNEKKGIKGSIKAVEETTKKAEVKIGHIIGIVAFTPILFSINLTWRVISAPWSALKDTVDAVSTVYKNLKEGTDEEEEA